MDPEDVLVVLDSLLEELEDILPASKYEYVRKQVDDLWSRCD